MITQLFDQRFFRLLSEYSQKEFALNDLSAALQELANYLASVTIEEQDYAVLLRCFSFGLNRLKITSYTIWAGGSLFLSKDTNNRPNGLKNNTHIYNETF